MLNFLGAIASLLPGYVQGRRQAISDNWQDLQNYNNIQAGQLSNAFTSATFEPRLDMFVDNVRRNNLLLRNDIMNTNIKRAYYPGQLDVGWAWSQNAGLNQYYQNLMQNQATQMMLSDRNLFQQMLRPSQQNPTNSTPSAMQIGG